MKILARLLVLVLATVGLSLVTPALPVAAVSVSTPTQLAIGSGHTCSLDNSGYVWCVGSNSNGQLGDGTTTDKLYPVRVNAGPFVSVSAGYSFTCALTAAGAAWCWGLNAAGQLGDGTNTDRYTPTLISGFTFTSLALGNISSCGLIPGGYAYCWGNNVYGALGINNSSVASVNVPTAVYNTTWTWKQLSITANSMCAIRSTDVAYCWGWNLYGQMGGNISGVDRFAPTVVYGSPTYKYISTGIRHVCAIGFDNLVYCWGYDYQGMLGQSGTAGGTQDRPVAATTVNGAGYTFTSLFLGGNVSCGTIADGHSYCWGYDGTGQMGTGGSGYHVGATLTFGGEAMVKWAIGPSYTICGINSLGVAKCSGTNSSGQLGNATTTASTSPVRAKFVLAQLSANASVTIDPSFVFTVAARSSACNGQLATMVTSTPTAIDLGHLNASTLSGGAHDLSVASNAGNGGAVYLRSALATGNLVGTSGSIADSGATAPVAGTEGFGYTTSDSNRGLASNTFATLTNVNAEVAYSASGSISPAQCVGYQVAVSSLTPAGQYAATIIYTAVPSF